MKYLYVRNKVSYMNIYSNDVSCTSSCYDNRRGILQFQGTFVSDLYNKWYSCSRNYVEDFSTKIAIVLHFQNTISHLRTYLLGHSIAFETKMYRKMSLYDMSHTFF